RTSPPTSISLHHEIRIDRFPGNASKGPDQALEVGPWWHADHRRGRERAEAGFAEPYDHALILTRYSRFPQPSARASQTTRIRLKKTPESQPPKETDALRILPDFSCTMTLYTGRYQDVLRPKGPRKNAHMSRC